MSRRKCCCGASPSCVSFEACSAAVTSPNSGPQVKGAFVLGTQLCQPRVPNSGFPPQLPANKVDFYPAYGVVGLGVTRGTPVYNSSGTNKYWTVPLSLDVRITSNCPEQCQGTSVTATITTNFKFDCSGPPDTFTARRPVAFNTPVTLCSVGGNAQVLQISYGRDTLNFVDTESKAASAISGIGCSAFDATIFEMYLPVTLETSSIPAPPNSSCRNLSRDNFPIGSATGAAIMRIQWSLLTP